ncbi:hypothetical protein FOA52_004561 [Chlamydomonas sp. UWO 241]|nr:hypothetical protein FOA52_004561 [Chlamydomonas sp. UWO 241]
MPGQLLMYPMSQRRWMDAKINVGYFSLGVTSTWSTGPEMEFGRTLIEAGVVPSGRVGFIPTAVGATYLAEWMPPWEWQPEGGELWVKLISVVREAMGKAGSGASLRGLIWVQGENDGRAQVDAETYGSRFATFVAGLRAELAPYNPRLPIVMGVMSTGPRLEWYTRLDVVRAAQLYDDPMTRPVVRVDMAIFSFYEQVFTGGVSKAIHLSKQGQCDMGAAMAKAWMASGLQAQA